MIAGKFKRNFFIFSNFIAIIALLSFISLLFNPVHSAFAGTPWEQTCKAALSHPVSASTSVSDELMKKPVNKILELYFLTTIGNFSSTAGLLTKNKLSVLSVEGSKYLSHGEQFLKVRGSRLNFIRLFESMKGKWRFLAPIWVDFTAHRDLKAAQVKLVERLMGDPEAEAGVTGIGNAVTQINIYVTSEEVSLPSDVYPRFEGYKVVKHVSGPIFALGSGVAPLAERKDE